MEQNTAVARSTDPQTSHTAAESVKDITDSQSAILRVLRNGPKSDHNLIAVYRAVQFARDYPNISDSGIRSRRAELVERGLVKASGGFDVLPSGRKSIIWQIVA